MTSPLFIDLDPPSPLLVANTHTDYLDEKDLRNDSLPPSIISLASSQESADSEEACLYEQVYYVNKRRLEVKDEEVRLEVGR